MSADFRTDPTPWVFDADGHVIEPPRVWDELLPAKFREYAPRVLQEADHYRFACGDRVGFRIEGHSEAMGAPDRRRTCPTHRSRCAAAPSPARGSTTWPSTASPPPRSTRPSGS